MLTIDRINQLVSIDFETGVLTWIDNYQRPDLIGKRAGWLNEGYWRVSIDGHSYYCCQIVWFVGHGIWPDKTLDHIDLDKANDALSNLRLATKGQNCLNSKLSSRNTSGFRGVSFCNTTQRWRSSIRINGREKNLGRYDTPEEAHEAWKAAAASAFGSEFIRSL
jgi:hypothetical protein